jgi:hypothetical protein
MKHIKLFENYIITKKLFGLENLLKSDTIDSIIDWGLDFLKQGVSYLMKNDLIIELLKKIKPDLLKEGKVRLIFPLQDWESDALEGLKKSGIVTGVFKKTNEAIDFIEKLTGAGIKIKELILGSHGSKDLFFIAKEQEMPGQEYSFFLKISKYLDKSGFVFFTSCYGADKLNNLYVASQLLRVPVWGSKGVYNYITNTSEGGFYWCDFSKVNSNRTVIDFLHNLSTGGNELEKMISKLRKKAVNTQNWDDYNKFLIDNKICGFSTKSPISWI